MVLLIRGPAAAALLATLLATGCAASDQPKPNAAVVAACQNRTEQTFNRQNRDLLSYREDNYTPFSNSYDSGITSAGLSRRFERDQLLSSCLNNNGVSSGSVTQPVTNGEAGGSSSLTAP